MTSKHEGKPGGGGVSFTPFPSSLILPCSTDYSPMYPPLLQRLLPPGLIHPQTSKHPLLSSSPRSLLSGSSTWGKGEREKEPGLGLPWLPKGFGQFKLEGPGQWADLGVVFISWPKNLEAAFLSPLEKSPIMCMGCWGATTGSLMLGRNITVCSISYVQPLAKCRWQLQETGSPLKRPFGSDASLNVWQPCSHFSSTGRPCRQGNQATALFLHFSPSLHLFGVNFEERVLEVFILATFPYHPP